MLIFDLDGTLWETVDATLAGANAIAHKYEEVKPFTKDVIEGAMGLSKIDNARSYMPYLSDEKALYYLDLINDATFILMSKDNVKLYDGVVDTIKNLSKKYKLGIVTNNNTRYAEKFLEVSGLKDYFTDFLGAISVNKTKGETIKLMVERNNEPSSYYIGDIKKDMESTIEAGITFIHARYGFEPNLECEYHIDSIRELEGLLEKIS